MISQQLPLIPDMPNGAQEAYLGLHVDQTGEYCDFTDYVARPVVIPRKGKSRVPVIGIEAAQILWDLKCGNLMLGEDEQTIYRRDTDWTGLNRRLNTWHETPDLNTEYNVPTAQRLQTWNRLALVELCDRAGRVRHGVRFADRAYRRDKTTGQVEVITNGPMLDDPWECTLDVPYDVHRAMEAVQWCRWLCGGDEHSAQNLSRMFATPLLEPYKALTFVLYGRGGNGKSITLDAWRKQFPTLTVSVDAARLLGGPRGGTGSFATEQEAVKLQHTLWAFDEDADEITPQQMTVLKKISTGDQMTARQIRKDAFTFHPRCTLIIATNNPVVTAMGEASDRRIVHVRLQDGRTPDEFRDYLAFLDAHGAEAMMMASCALWADNSRRVWRDVAIGGEQDLSEGEQWLVDEIVDHGYAVGRDNPYRIGHGDYIRAVSKLGLSTERRSVDGRQIRVLVVADPNRFKPYMPQDDKPEDGKSADVFTPRDPILPIPDPISEVDPMELKRLGFACAFVPAGADKVARDWKKTAEQGGIVTPAGLQAYGVVPMPGCCIIDMDVPKDGDDGWTVLQREVGAYGSAAFPATWLVRTQSGGVHAYYRVPPELQGKLKNRVHPGVPVDLRAEMKGYVLGAGSHGVKGDYRLVDLPAGQVPELSAQLCDWLAAHDCTTLAHGANVKPMQLPMPTTPVQQRQPSRMPTLDELMAEPQPTQTAGRVDMSVIPEGQRNDRLHAWVFGRLANHPGESLRIRQDLFQRGHASGLGDTELTGIWNSCVRELSARGLI